MRPCRPTDTAAIGGPIPEFPANVAQLNGRVSRLACVQDNWLAAEPGGRQENLKLVEKGDVLAGRRKANIPGKVGDGYLSDFIPALTNSSTISP